MRTRGMGISGSIWRRVPWDVVTTVNAVRKPRVQGFYGYYRNSIEDEFAALQDMFAQLRKVTGDPPKPKLRFIRNCKL